MSAPILDDAGRFSASRVLGPTHHQKRHTEKRPLETGRRNGASTANLPLGVSAMDTALHGRQRRSTRAASSAGPQRAVQVERSADQCKVRESLREVSQGLAAMTGLFRVEANMVGKAEHPLENQSRFLKPRPVVATGSGQRLDQ